MTRAAVARALLRSCRGISPQLLAEQEESFAAALDQPMPGELELIDLERALLAGGVETKDVQALLLLVAKHTHEIGRHVVVPPSVAGLPADTKAALLAQIEPVFERHVELMPAIAESDARFDHTPAVASRELSLAVASRRSATLLVLGGQSLGKLFRLEGLRALIGRAPTADIILDDDGISRYHAVVTRDGDALHIEDLGSRNGLIINGFKVTRHDLEDGDRIQLGANTLLKFAYQDDIEERFQQELYRSVIIDALTGVYNRRHLMERTRAECAFARRTGSPVSVLMIDIDNFKNVNDTHGHSAGDEVLRCVAQALLGALRQEDVFGRYGGEEFCAVLRGITAAQAEQATGRLLELVRGLVVAVSGRQLRVTVSIGSATSRSGALDTPQELIDAADEALYQAKAGGRDRSVASTR